VIQRRLAPLLSGASLCLLLAACGAAQTTPATSSPASPAAAASAAGPKPAATAAGSAAASAKPATGASPVDGAGAKPSAAAKPGSDKLVVAYSTIASLYLPLWMCGDGGVCARNNLDVDVRLMPSSGPAMAALLAGEIQIYQGGGSDVLAAAANGADLVALATMAPVYPYKLEVAADIKTPADLKGKKLAIGSIGDTSDVATRLALQSFGLEAEKDVALVAVGGVPQRTAALQSGAVQGTVDSPPSNLNLEKLGFHPLVDIATLGGSSANQVVTVQRSWLSAHKDVAQRYIDSMVQAVVKAKSDKALSISLLKKYYKSDDTDAMTFAYDYATREAIASQPFTTVEQFKDSVTQLNKTNPKIATFDISKIIDSSLLQSAIDRKLDVTPVS
jgi:NitT/TauT family transport system substrate-binding protein